MRPLLRYGDFGGQSYDGLQVLTSVAVGQVSTYLVAYANGPFEYLESSYTSPLSGKVRPLRIYGRQRTAARFATRS